MGRYLIFIGLMIAGLGLIFVFGEHFGLGKLPGDITLKGERYELHFPIVTCLLISGTISLVMWLVRYFGGHR